MTDVKDNFEFQLEQIKKETHKQMEDLCDRFPNAKNWRKINENNN